MVANERPRQGCCSEFGSGLIKSARAGEVKVILCDVKEEAFSFQLEDSEVILILKLACS